MSSGDEIAVIGGGLIGTVAALALANSCGGTITHFAPVLDEPDGRTTALLQDAVALLKTFGVWERASEFAAPMRTMWLLDGTQRLLRSSELQFRADEIGLDAFGYNVENDRLVPLLRALATEHLKIRQIDERVEDVVMRPDGATIRTSGLELESALVVGADGRSSPTREAAGISTRKWSYDQAALVTTFTHTRPHGDASVEVHTRTGPFTQVPLRPSGAAEHRSSLVWVVRPDEVTNITSLSTGRQNDIIAEQFDHRFGSVEVEKPLRSYPLSGLIAETAGTGLAVLVGEASHVFPPIGAQGANLGFRDVADLVSAIRREPDLKAAVTAYARSRKADTVARTIGVDALNRSVLSDLLPVQIARTAGIGALRRSQPLKRALMSFGMAPARS